MDTNASTINGTIASASQAGESRPLLYEVTGKGEPIVLLPGTLTGWASWVSHAERLSTTRQVVRVQLRNVELAEDRVAAPETYGIETEIEGFRRAIDDIGLDRFDLVGWSLGGLVSLAFGMRYPERVRTLTLIEPAAPWVLGATGVKQSWLAEIEASDRRISGKQITIDDLKSFLGRAGIGSEDTDIESHPRWPLMVQNRQALAVVDRVWNYTDSLERLKALEIPALLVMGAESARFDRLIAQTIAGNMPHATLLELPGDHACHVEYMDQFLDALERHLGR